MHGLWWQIPWLPRFTWAGWLCVVAAAVAVALAVPGPAAAPRRLARPSTAPRFWATVARPRPGALPPVQRLMLAIPAAAGLTLVAGSLIHHPGWWQTVLVLPLTVGGVVALGRVEGGRSRRDRDRVVQDAPQCWELLSVCLEAGLPLRAALAEVVAVTDGPLADVLGEVLARMRLGEDGASAWRSIGDHPQLGRTARDLARSMDSGILVAGLLNDYAQQARDARHGRAQERAKSVGVAAVIPLMVCFLPAFFLVGVVPIVAGALLPLLTGW